MSQYPIIAVPESVDVLLGVLHHLLELVGAGDLGRRLEVGPAVYANMMSAQINGNKFTWGLRRVYTWVQLLISWLGTDI